MDNLFKKPSFFRLLVKRNGPAVYALVNERSQKVLVVSAIDFITSLARNVSLLSSKTHPNRELQKAAGALRLVFHEHVEDPAFLQIKKSALMERYKSLGYALYNKERMGSYRVRVSLSMGKGSAQAQVQVVSRGKRVWAVRDFPTIEQAEAFIAERSIWDVLLDLGRRLQ